jgi:hypothetical protein
MSILKYEKYLESLLKESRDYGVQVETTTFHSVRDLLDWMENLKNIDNTAVRDKVNTLNPTYFKGLQRKLIKLYDEGEIDTSEDAERFILGEKQTLTEGKRILFPTEYDVYLKDKEYMKFFNKVKTKILILFPNHNISNIDLLIDKIYTYYTQNYDIDDTVNKLYTSGDLYSFWTSNLDI